MRSLVMVLAAALCLLACACNALMLSPYPMDRGSEVLRGDEAKREIEARRDRPHEGRVEGTSSGPNAETTRTMTYRDGAVGVVTTRASAAGKETEYEFRPAK